tara:strand:+ start:8194 stop:8817 length:624 start_codon:yes stop_codon:yes gene_type:complete
MIKLYSWSTPNGRKISILLEELKVKYKIIPININKKEQFNKEYLKIAPSNKIPAIEDTDNKKFIFESGAILLYLAKKYNKFINPKKEWETISWLMYQMSEAGPMLGQAHQFLFYNPGKSKFAEKKFHKRAIHIYRILEKRLESNKYIVGKYSIVDIAYWPWIARYKRHKINILKFPNILQWFKRISLRPAVIGGYNVVGVKENIPFS